MKSSFCLYILSLAMFNSFDFTLKKSLPFFRVFVKNHTFHSVLVIKHVYTYASTPLKNHNKCLCMMFIILVFYSVSRFKNVQPDVSGHTALYAEFFFFTKYFCPSLPRRWAQEPHLLLYYFENYKRTVSLWLHLCKAVKFTLNLT